MQSFSEITPPRRLPWAVWFGNIALLLYMVLSIFHIFPSGLPQPSDFVIALAILLNVVMFVIQPHARFKRDFLFFLGFGLFTFMINFVHFLFMPDTAFLKSSFYYIYNVSFFILAANLIRYSPQHAWKVLYTGLVIAIVLEIIIINFIPSLRGFRETGTFANPNQLAVWSLLAACMLVLLKARSRLNLFDVGLLLGLGFIQTVSLSKAGIICYLLLVGVLVCVPALTARTRLVFVFLSLILAIYGLNEATKFENVISKIGNVEHVISRVETIGLEKDDSLAGRGYTRIAENPGFLIVGAGEGGYLRFSDTTYGYELHSGLGTLIFSYGIIGFCLFVFLLGLVAYRNDKLVVAMLVIVFLYGLTHQNIRTADFWLFLALCYVYKDIDFSTFVRRPRGAGPYLPASGFSST
jgi:hypothetical protein